MKNELINVSGDELILLAEGELDREQRNELFRRLDQHPSQWRQCALELLEASSVAASHRSLLLGHRETEAVEKTGIDARPTHSIKNKRGTEWKKRVVPLILAASIVVAATAGFLAGRHRSIGPTSNEFAQAKKIAEADSMVHQLAQAQLDKFVLEDMEPLAVVELDHRDRKIIIPVVTSKRLTEQMTRNPIAPISSNEIQTANRRGWNVTQQQQFLAIEVPDEKVKLIPIGVMRIRPVRRNLF